MYTKKFSDEIREQLFESWETVKFKILYWWILNIKSRTLTVSHKPAIVFAPHQDDETLGCGGLMALKHELGTPIKVVFLTDGRKSHLHIKPEELIQIRKQEAVNALNILGIASSDIYFLDYIDGSLMQLPKEEHYRIINELAQILQSFQPSEVYLPHRKDKHNDHQATYDLVQAALIESKVQVEVFEYPIWLFWNVTQLFKLNLQELGDSYNLSIRTVYEKKQRAIKAYDSQCQIFPSSFIRRFAIPHEIFFKRPIQN